MSQLPEPPHFYLRMDENQVDNLKRWCQQLNDYVQAIGAPLTAPNARESNWVDDSSYDDLGRHIRHWQDTNPPYAVIDRPINAGPPS